MSDTSSTSRGSQPPDPARIVADHLPAGYTADFDGRHDNGKYGASASGPSTPTQSAEESSLKLQGGDVHRDLFKMNASKRNNMHRRANTFHSVPDVRHVDDTPFTVGDQLIPGGFRRAFLQQRHGDDFLARRIPITRNFVEFLDLYGSFAGEDLVDTDEEAVVEGEEAEPGERQPLLRHGPLSVRAPRPADAGTLKTFFTLIKAFVGTGIMFLPKAFSNGGILFSTVAMLVVSAITMVAFHLLLRLEQRYPGGYGEIGEAIAGRRMRTLILVSIALSQLGFVCAGMVFVAENLHEFFASVTGGNSPFTAAELIAAQAAILVPLAWIRNISKLGPLALLADVCIVVGIGYLYWFTTTSLATTGPAESVILFNPARYTLMLGSAIFTFEGIGLILPIQASMAQPHHFEPLLALVMLIITAVFTSVGALCYAVFGADTRIEVISNLPRNKDGRIIGIVDAVQLLYAIAVLVGTPVQLFPALRIAEARLFGPLRSGKGSPRTKWAKNAFRFAVVGVCALIALAGAGNLDRFVALIGSVACVPLVYVYPAYLHWKGVARSSRRWRWRPMTPTDLPAVMRIGDEIHRDLPEDEAVFRERLLLFPAGCFVLEVNGFEDGEGGNSVARKDGSETSTNIGGYIISFPVRRNRPPALNARFPGGVLPVGADQYYLHDVAVLPQFRGRGAASAGVRMILRGGEGKDGDQNGNGDGNGQRAEDRRGPAAGYETTALVSVYGTARFWERFGFRVVATAETGLVRGNERHGAVERAVEEEGHWEALRDKLRGYGDDAKFMVRQNRVV
ncbi:hypothetical protein VTJ49DRAFT_944 [Mycothermus thermophilus]|uniref:N-acetyltransferase domain-containing protein n=1 Tax=Humicola insolens TaxID=85995 RepID=A0ABR3VEY6_HUMIN